MSNEYPPPHPGQEPEGQSNQLPPPPPPPPSGPQWNPQSGGAPAGPGGAAPYGQPAYGQPPGYPPASGAPDGYGQPQKNAPLAIVSLVLGIVGVPCCTLFVFGIAAVVTGFLARRQIDASQGALKGGGMAMAGLVLGAVTIVLAIVVWVLNLTGAIDSNYSFETN